METEAIAPEPVSAMWPTTYLGRAIARAIAAVYGHIVCDPIQRTDPSLLSPSVIQEQIEEGRHCSLYAEVADLSERNDDRPQSCLSTPE